MINVFIKLWNKIFGKTIKKQLNKSNKDQPVTSHNKILQTSDLTVIDLNKETNVLDVDLVDNNIDEIDKTELRQYTKKLVSKITNFAIIWISWSYVLASYAVFKYGEFNPLESLSETVGKTLLGVVITYGFKALLETYLKKKNEKEILLNQMNNDTQKFENETFYDDDEMLPVDDENAVG